LQEVLAVFPVAPANYSFPVVSFSHGDLGGGYDLIAYAGLFHEIASHGIVVAAHASCGPFEKTFGCNDTQYLDQLQVVTWALDFASSSSVLPINRSVGVAVAGHSTGGRSTLQSAQDKFAVPYRIKAAVGIHPDPKLGAASNIHSVPLAIFTGDKDIIEPTGSALADWIAAKTPKKVFASFHGVGHLEPILPHSKWGLYTAAFVKWSLLGDLASQDVIFGNSTSSLCSGKLYAVVDCKHQWQV